MTEYRAPLDISLPVSLEKNLGLLKIRLEIKLKSLVKQMVVLAVFGGVFEDQEAEEAWAPARHIARTGIRCHH